MSEPELHAVSEVPDLSEDFGDDEVGEEEPPRPPRPRKKRPKWLLVLVGLTAGAGLTIGVQRWRELRDRPGHGVTVASKPAATRAPWIADGYVELVPAIRLPSHVNGKSRIEVWLKVPDGAKISAKRLEDQQRWTLVYPPGTIADRLEMVDGEHVVDVRGTEIAADGTELFHVYRRQGEGMRGFVWKRGDEEQQLEATRVLVAHARHVENAPDREIQGIRINNDCGPCHAHERAASRALVRNRPNRASDSAGFFVPETVLADRVVTEYHRPREMNVGDPLIGFHCLGEDGADVAAVLDDRPNGTRWPTCGDGSNPVGFVDVAAGLAKDDTHVKRLCASRKALFDRMDDTARKAFASAFAACRID